MKAYVAAGALLATGFALPAAAQTWYDPAALLHNSYAEVEGGLDVQGRTKIDIAATGLGTSQQSAAQDSEFFGGGLVGYTLAEGVSIEGEGIYSRDHLAYGPNNAVFGTGGATRTYGGLGNLRFSLPFTPTYTLSVASHTLPIGIKPYIAGGVGYGNVEFSGRNGAFTYRDSQDGFIWQGKAGLEIRTGRHIAFDLAYRYLESPDYNYPGSFNSPGYSSITRSHLQAATLGVKYYF